MDVEYRYDWKLIACVDDHWGIGRQGQLLVDIPADKNPNKVEKGVAKIVVDGKEYTGTTVIPYEKGKTSYDVTIVMG